MSDCGDCCSIQLKAYSHSRQQSVRIHLASLEIGQGEILALMVGMEFVVMVLVESSTCEAEEMPIAVSFLFLF